MTKTYQDVEDAFLSLCLEWNIPVPILDLALPSDPCDVTSHDEVRINVEAAPDVEAGYHAAHVLGHYLCCLHAEADEREGGAETCDLVADIIAKMALK